MKIIAAEWIPYRLPFRRPWVSAAGTLEERRGRLLKLVSDQGLCGWGDCAPFPEIGISEAAASAYAQECAHLDLAAQAEGISLAAYLAACLGVQCLVDPALARLSREVPGREPIGLPINAAAGIAVNAALGDIQSLDPTRLQDACAAGFPVLKIKVGSAAPQADLARLEELSRLLPPGVTWRLDANCAWDEATAASFLSACARLPVEGVEEPLQEPNFVALKRLQDNLPFPLALDESWHLVGPDFLAAPPVRRLILKPPRHGGLLAACHFARAAHEAGVECIVTSSLESACGLSAAAHLAAAIAPQAVHGLATAGWFLQDTGPTPAINQGRLALPPGPGLGFSYAPGPLRGTDDCS